MSREGAMRSARCAMRDCVRSQVRGFANSLPALAAVARRCRSGTRQRAHEPTACSLAPPREPAAGESGAAEAARQMWIAAHETPHELGALVLDHEEDGSLVDAEVVRVEPADAGMDAALRDSDAAVGERRVEGVDEAVPAEQRVA